MLRLLFSGLSIILLDFTKINNKPKNGCPRYNLCHRT
jgi:hypothetical protein